MTIFNTFTQEIDDGLTIFTGSIDSAITISTSVIDTGVSEITNIANTLYTDTTQVVSTITNCVEENSLETSTNIYYCCKNNVTNDKFKCSTGLNNLNNVTYYNLIDLPCFNSNWFNYTTNTIKTNCNLTKYGQQTGCKKETYFQGTSVNTTNITQALSYLKTTSIVESYCGVNIKEVSSETAFLYVSTDPLFECNLKLFNIKKNFCDCIERKYIPYQFTNLDIWRINYDYNLKSFSRINYYFESTSGISYFTGIKYNSLPLYSISNSINKNLSIFTTMVSYRLINDNYTNDKTIYFKKLKLLCRKILSSIVRFRLLTREKVIKNSLSKDAKSKLLKKTFDNFILKMNKSKSFNKIFENFYLSNSYINLYLRKYNSSLFFIINLIYKNARDKNIDVNNELFIKLTHKLLWMYNSRFVINTKMINKIYYKFYGIILDKNYDKIFNKWILYIYKSKDPIKYICAKYASQLMTFEELLNGDIETLLNNYFDLSSVRIKYITYLVETKKNVCSDCDKYQNIENFDIQTKNKIKKICSEIVAKTNEKKFYEKIKNCYIQNKLPIKKKCNNC